MWLDADPLPCNICCRFQNLTFGSTSVSVYNTVFSSMLVIAMIALLIILHAHYRRAIVTGFDYFQRPVMALTKKSDADAPTVKWILPFYFGFVSALAAWFLAQSVMVMAGKDSIALNYLQQGIFSGGLAFDSMVIVFLCMPRISATTRVLTIVISVCLGVALLAYVLIINRDTAALCVVCGFHTPTPMIWIPYMMFGMFALAAGITSRVKKSGYRPRPAALYWAVFVSVPYISSAVYLAAGHYTGWSGGMVGFAHCGIIFNRAWYEIGECAALYVVITSDSQYCLSMGLAADLISDSADVALPALLNSNLELYEELRDALRAPGVALARAAELKIIRRVGAGGYAEVYEAQHRGLRVAVKKMLCFGREATDGEDDVEALRSLVQEFSMLTRVRHHNCVIVMGLCLDASNQSILMEYVDGGTLWEACHERGRYKGEGRLLTEELLPISHGMCKGMEYLHLMKIMHRDLKSPNVLLDANRNPKICDFGLARTFHAGTMTSVGTPAWSSPEVLRMGVYDYSADVYSFGVCLWEMLERKVPWNHMPALQVAHLVAYEDGHLDDPSGPEPYLTLYFDCVSSPKDRPTFSAIIEQLAAGSEVHMSPTNSLQRSDIELIRSL